MNKHSDKDLKKMMDDIADRLRLERISRGYTQEQFAEILEISSRQYGRYENKKSKIPLNRIFGLESAGVNGYYLLIGRFEQDVFIERALETISEDELLKFLDAVAKDNDDNAYNSLLQNDIENILIELIIYGKAHFNDKKLRKIPEFRFLTNCYETYRASLIKNAINTTPSEERRKE